jgi:prepilin-type N-terminal cleavage/methylation domain-containing protein
MIKPYFKKIKGFTLVELVMVIIISGILTLVSLSIHGRYVKNAIDTEGKRPGPRTDNDEIYAETNLSSDKNLTVNLILKDNRETDNFAVCEN